MTPLDQAMVMLRKAAQDEAVAEKLLNDPDIADETWCFHAQQAIEKFLKAVLFSLEIPFRRSHDLVELAGLLCDHGVNVPFPMDSFEELNPFAVAMRYDESDATPVDRHDIGKLVGEVGDWAKNLCESD